VLEHFIHHKSHTYCPGIEFRLLWQETGNKLHEHALAVSQTYDTKLSSEPTNPVTMKVKRVMSLTHHKLWWRRW